MLGIGRIGPVIVVERHGEHDGVAVRGEGGVELGEERLADPSAPSAGTSSKSMVMPWNLFLSRNATISSIRAARASGSASSLASPLPSHFPSTAFWIMGRIGTVGLRGLDIAQHAIIDIGLQLHVRTFES